MAPPVKGAYAAARQALSPSNSRVILLLLLALAVMAVFLPVCRYEFLNFDDQINLSANPYIIGGAVADFLHFWQHPYANLYIPVTYSIWALAAKIAAGAGAGNSVALAPEVFHALNLLTHLANVLLVFIILRKLLPDVVAAWAGALFFAIHPVQVEAVAWSSEFRGLLSCFWALLSIYQYLLYLGAAKSGRRAQPHYGLATLFFCLAMLSKPAVVVLPLLVGLMGYLVFNRPPRQLAKEFLPWLLLAAPIVGLTRFAQQAANIAFQPAIWQRVLIGGDSLTFSAYKLLVPLTFGPDYGRTPEYVLAHGWVWITGLLPWMLIALLLARASRAAIFAVVFWGGGLLPVLGLLSFDFQKISTATDRYQYLALLGPAVGIGLLWGRLSGQRLLRYALIGALLLLGVRSAFQVQYWENDFTFNRHALQVNPRSWLASNNLGFAYFVMGQPRAAIPHYEAAIRLNPGNLAGHANLGDAQAALGLYREALTSYQNALALSPVNPFLLFSLGETYLSLQDKEQAIAAFRQALMSKPDYSEASQRLHEISPALPQLSN